jgi:hypothetical protein
MNLNRVLTALLKKERSDIEVASEWVMDGGDTSTTEAATNILRIWITDLSKTSSPFEK